MPTDTVSKFVDFTSYCKLTSSEEDKVWCGMGRRNDKGDPVPVSTLHALPNENYGFTPVNTFYLVAGQTEVGTIITVEQLSK